MTQTKRIYWDSCVWIAYINKETKVPLKSGEIDNRYEKCLELFKQAKNSDLEIVTSAFTLAEVCRLGESPEGYEERLHDFFDRTYILIVPLDNQTGFEAQRLMISGICRQKPADAVHIASALRAGAVEMHSFDEDILKRDGNIVARDGTPLKICKPSTEEPLGPLFSN